MVSLIFLIITVLSQVVSASPFTKTEAIFVRPAFNLVGERLEFSTHLRGLPVGRQVLEFESTKDYQERTVYVVTFKGFPNLMLRAINYTNDEVYYLDTETFLPLYTSRTYSAGFSSGFMETFFLEGRNEVEVEVTENETRGFTSQVTEPFQGETTLILFSRFADATKKPLIEVFSGSGIQYLQLLPGGFEEVTVGAGTFKAEVVLISPEIGKVWLSNDKYRIPLKIVLETNAGELELNLISATR